MNSNSAAIVVPPAPLDLATNDIRGLLPPVDIPNAWAWVWWIAGLIVLAAAAAALYTWLNRKAAVPEPARITPPHVRARQQLDAALRFIHDPQRFCVLVSAAVRVYLEERFQFHAPERTTEEFLSELRHTDRLLPDQKLSLAEFLENCDLVKFARFEPNEAALRELHEAALRLVEETQDYACVPAPSAPSSVSHPHGTLPPPPPPAAGPLTPPPPPVSQSAGAPSSRGASPS